MKKIFLIAVFTLASPLSVFAQELSLSLSPPLVEAVMKPGRSFTKAYSIKNEGDTSLYLKTSIVSFVPGPEGEIIYRENAVNISPSLQFSLANARISLGETFLLSAGQSDQLVLKVTAPDNLSQGDYYFTFFVEQSPQGNFLGESGTLSRAKIGSHLLISISETGEAYLEGKVSRFFAQPKWGDIFTPVTFSVWGQNTGSSLFKAAGKIEIFDIFGKKKKEVAIRPDNILVDSQRKLVCPDSCSFSSLIPGRYRAVASLSLNENGPKAAPATIYFYLLPGKLIAVLAIFFFFLFLLSSHYNGYKKINEKNKDEK